MKNFKNIHRIFLALTLGLLLSCSSDDETTTESNNFASDIIGEWELISVTSNGIELIDDGDCFDRIEITDSTYEYIEYADFEDGNGCVEVGGQTNSPEPYTLTGSNFSTSDEGETFEVEIIELNSTRLKFQEVYTEDGETFTDIETYNRLQ
jgi:hypothetical protein